MSAEHIQITSHELDGKLTANRINFNTRVIHTESTNFTTPLILNNLPRKVRDRIKINIEGLNNLSTTIVTPESQKYFTKANLHEVLEFSKPVNEKIGLPTRSDLIIRTSRRKPFLNSKVQRKVEISEPSLLVTDIGTEEESYELKVPGNPPRKFQSIDQFFGILQPDTFLLIHDDNFTLQYNSVHGRLLITKSGAELIIATETMHPRGIGTSLNNAPYLRFNSEYPEYLFKANPQFIDAYLGEKITKPVDFSRLRIYSERLTPQKGAHILEQTQAFSNEILHYYERVTRCFGPNSSMEFRLYPSTGTVDQQRLHVLDSNTKFS